MNPTAIERPIRIASLATGRLYRAFVVLPAALCRPGHTYDERTVFFEAPRGKDEAAHLEQLLSTAWCVDTQGWAEDGAIYNIYSAAELYERNPDPTADLGCSTSAAARMASGPPRRITPARPTSTCS